MNVESNNLPSDLQFLCPLTFAEVR